MFGKTATQSTAKERKRASKKKPSSSQASVPYLITLRFSDPDSQIITVDKEGNGQCVDVPVSELTPIVGHCWEDMVYAHETDYKKIFVRMPSENSVDLGLRKKKETFQEVVACHQRTTNQLSLYNIGEGLGFGVKAKDDFHFDAENPEQHMLLINGGWSCPGPREGAQFKKDPTLLRGYGTDIISSQGKVIFSLDPHGVNPSVLMAHAPSKEQLKEEWWVAGDVPLEKIATVNTSFSAPVWYADAILPVAAVVIGHVGRGEVVLRGYGTGYWVKKEKLFFKNGEVVPVGKYLGPRLLELTIKGFGTQSLALSGQLLRKIVEQIVRIRTYALRLTPAENSTVIEVALMADFLHALEKSDAANKRTIKLTRELSLLTEPRTECLAQQIKEFYSNPKDKEQNDMAFFRSRNNPSEQYKQAVALVKSGDYGKAVQLFSNLISRYKEAQRKGKDYSRTLQNLYDRLGDAQFYLAQEEDSAELRAEAAENHQRAWLGNYTIGKML